MLNAWLQGRYCIAIARLVFYTADTLTVRLLMAWGSGVYAVLLVWPHISNALRTAIVEMMPVLGRWVGVQHVPDLFTRPAYAIMALVPGGSWTWAGLFLLHMIGVHWRALDPKESIPWALAINILGLVVWAYSTASLALSLGTLLPSSALELVVIFFSFWILVRTGLQPEIVTA